MQNGKYRYRNGSHKHKKLGIQPYEMILTCNHCGVEYCKLAMYKNHDNEYKKGAVKSIMAVYKDCPRYTGIKLEHKPKRIPGITYKRNKLGGLVAPLPRS